MDLLDFWEGLRTWGPGRWKPFAVQCHFSSVQRGLINLMLKPAAKAGELLAQVADVAETGAAHNCCRFVELNSVHGSKVRPRALLCRTESSKETLSPIEDLLSSLK